MKAERIKAMMFPAMNSFRRRKRVTKLSPFFFPKKKIPFLKSKPTRYSFNMSELKWKSISSPYLILKTT